MTRGLRGILFSGGTYGAAADFGILVLRSFFGLALAFGHGINKWPPSERFIAGVQEMQFPAPVLFAWASAFAELVCGLLVAIGLSTRFAATLITLNMFVAAFIRQAGDPFNELELALAYLAASVAIALTGAGGFSLDALLKKRVGKR